MTTQTTAILEFKGRFDQMWRGEEGFIFKTEDEVYFVQVENNVQINWTEVVEQQIKIRGYIKKSSHPEVPDSIVIQAIE